MNPKSDSQKYRGRGATSNHDSRFVAHHTEEFDDGWPADEVTPIRTEVRIDKSRSIINYNQSPDVPFDRSINPYRGCEHGCSYCFARPTHAYLDLSPGIDFESKIFSKPEAAILLRQELGKKGYCAAPIALGVNTDAYQPLERKLQITRQIIEVLKAHQHPVAIVTKSALVERDIDLLSEMATNNLVQVMISVTSLDRGLSRSMEPRAASPERRLQTIRNLSQAGIPVGVLYAPVIPALNDHEMESVLSAITESGATTAAYVMLRLPHEVKDLFQDWLRKNYPLKAAHVINLIREMRGGRLNLAIFGERQTGIGEYAKMIQQRFNVSCKANELNQKDTKLNCSLFRVPKNTGEQFRLFE